MNREQSVRYLRVFISAILAIACGSIPFLIPDWSSVLAQQIYSAQVGFTQTTFAVNEDDGTATITVAASGTANLGADFQIMVDFSTSNGTATAGDDYTAVTQTLTFTANQLQQTVTIPILDDEVAEVNETVNLILSNARGTVDELSIAVGTSPGTATLTINDNDPGMAQVGFTQTEIAVDETAGEATVTMALSGGDTLDPSFQVLVDFATNNGTATTGDDYTAITQTLTFTANQLQQTVTIPILDDTDSEGNETVNLTLGNARGTVDGNAISVDLSPENATLTIVDDEPPPGSQIEKVSGDRQSGAPGTEVEPLMVRVTGPAGQPLEGVPVTWSPSPSDAASLPRSTTITDSNGETSNTLIVSQAGTITVTAAAQAVGSAEFIINSGFAFAPGLTETQRRVASALDNACPALQELGELTAGQEDLLATCNLLASGEVSLNVALQQLAHEEVSVQGTAMIETSITQFTNVGARLIALRSGTKGFSLAGLNLNLDGQALPGAIFSDLFSQAALGGAASADESALFGRWGIFVNGNVSVGDKDATDREPGFDFDTKGVTAGVDYRFNDHFILGGAFGYASTDSDFNGSSGSLDTEAFSVSLYGTYYLEHLYIDGIFNIGWNDFDSQRGIVFGDIDQVAKADTDGEEYSFSIGAGYDFNRGGFTFGPYGRVDYIKADIDGFKERPSDPGSPGFGLMLEIEDQDITSLTSVLGGQASYAISTGFGVILPQLRLEWEHQFKDDDRLIGARFLNDPTNTEFSVPTDDPDRDFFNLGVGVSATFAHGRSAFIYYEKELGREDITQDSVAVGVRLEF